MHDLKNDTARFNAPLQKLLAIAENGDYSDLKIECYSFANSFAASIREFESQCDQVLRKSSVRSLRNVKVSELIGNAWRGQIKKTKLQNGSPRGIYQGDSNLEIFTSEYELRLVIENLIANVFDHFTRRKQVGEVKFTVTLEHSGSMIKIKISDTIHEKGCYNKVRKILDDKDTPYTLCRFVRPVVEKVLYGSIWPEIDDEFGNLCMCLQVPTKSKTR